MSIKNEFWFEVTMRDINGIPVMYTVRAHNKDDAIRKVIESSRFTLDDLIGVDDILNQELYIG